MAVTFTTTDLDFILEQIKMAEAGQPPVSPHLAFGLREVAGTDNSSIPGQENFGAADQVFPQMTDSSFRTVTIDASMLAGTALAPFAVFAAPDGTLTTSYVSTAPGGFVIDADPRLISNLIADQTANNPAAVEARRPHSTRSASATRTRSRIRISIPNLPADPTNLQFITNNDATPTDVFADGNLFIPNVTPDAGLSAPFNSWFTFFGQFFDHGLDLVTKGGNGTVFIPLAAGRPADPRRS